MDDLQKTGMYSIWLVPEERWLTAWDFLRTDDYGIEDAWLAFHNPLAAASALLKLSPVLRPYCLIKPIVVEPPYCGR